MFQFLTLLSYKIFFPCKQKYFTSPFTVIVAVENSRKGNHSQYKQNHIHFKKKMIDVKFFTSEHSVQLHAITSISLAEHLCLCQCSLLNIEYAL